MLSLNAALVGLADVVRVHIAAVGAPSVSSGGKAVGEAQEGGGVTGVDAENGDGMETRRFDGLAEGAAAVEEGKRSSEGAKGPGGARIAVRVLDLASPAPGVDDGLASNFGGLSIIGCEVSGTAAPLSSQALPPDAFLQEMVRVRVFGVMSALSCVCARTHRRGNAPAGKPFGSPSSPWTAWAGTRACVRACSLCVCCRASFFALSSS